MTLDSSLIPPNWHSRSILTDAIMGNTPSFRQLDKRIVKAFFYKYDSELARHAREDFQDIFNHIINKSGSEISLKEEIFCFRLLTYYPFLRPEGETVEFPLPVDGKIRRAVYRFERIQLTDDKLISPIVAYGLVADNAPPLLVFKGTTFPADDGFARSLLADFTPNKSVGGDVLDNPTEELKNWVSDKNEIIVMGLSLGGSLAQHFGVKFADKTKKIYAFSAPRLLHSEVIENGPRCIRVNTKGDIVAKVGNAILPNTLSYEIETDEKYNLFWRHVIAPETRRSKEIREKEEDDSFLAKLHLIFSPVIYFIASIAISIFLYFDSLFKAAYRLIKT